MADWADVSPLEGWGADDYRVVDVDDVMIAVFNIAGEYLAIEDVCTHDGAPMADGEIEGTDIICPRHGARFCLKSGKALTPPAYESVVTFETRIHNGMVQVRDARWD